MSSVQSELGYILYESQAEMLENVPNPPYRPVPLRIATHHTHGTNQIHRISPNRFGKAIRKKSASVRQGIKVLPIWHGYAMMRETFVRCGRGSNASRQVGISCPEPPFIWLFQRENVKLFGICFIRNARLIRSLWGLGMGLANQTLHRDEWGA